MKQPRRKASRLGLSLFVLGGVLLCPARGGAQVALTASRLAGTVNIFNSDSAILEAQEPRKDLACSVNPAKPLLGFDLKFHAGYEVTVPLRELAGSDNLLTIIFRVTPQAPHAAARYFSQRIRVPDVEDDAKGDAYLQGAFDLGEGLYHVDWLMRDRAERVCSHYWDVDAELSPKDKEIGLVLPPWTAHASEGEPFKEEPPVDKAPGEPSLNVKVLINFAPLNGRSTVLQPVDANALASILRSIVREPRIGKLSTVAFNLQEQRIVYRQENADGVNFPALGEAVQSLSLGTVDLKRLSARHGDTDFLANLIVKEATSGPQPDALIFAGPKAMLEENVSQETMRDLGNIEYPVFYMNYNLNPQANPWRDTIGNAVKSLKGTEFTITRPRDLWFAVSDMVSRIVKSKRERVASAASR